MHPYQHISVHLLILKKASGNTVVGYQNIYQPAEQRSSKHIGLVTTSGHADNTRDFFYSVNIKANDLIIDGTFDFGAVFVEELKSYVSHGSGGFKDTNLLLRQYLRVLQCRTFGDRPDALQSNI